MDDEVKQLAENMESMMIFYKLGGVEIDEKASEAVAKLYDGLNKNPNWKGKEGECLKLIVSQMEEKDNKEIFTKAIKPYLVKKAKPKPRTIKKTSGKKINSPSPVAKKSIEEKLKELKDFYEKKLISKELYEQKQKDVMKDY